MLILPGDPLFDLTLGTVTPPANPGSAFIVRPGSLVMVPASESEVYEFLNSGEYDERMAEIEDDEPEFS